jgi:hypothetical protein
MDYCIGSDVLDLGSRRAESKAKRSLGPWLDQPDAALPTHFDVPNVSDVRA